MRRAFVNDYDFMFHQLTYNIDALSQTMLTDAKKEIVYNLLNLTLSDLPFTDFLKKHSKKYNMETLQHTSLYP